MPRAQDQLPSRFRRALLYVVEALGNVNVTKLQKILYMTDLEHFHATGTTLTGARWVRYTHGPMAKALVPSRELMDGYELDVQTEARGSYSAQVYRPGPAARFRPGLALEEKATLDRVLRTMRSLSTSDAIALAYNTSPMRVLLAMEAAAGGGIMLNADLPFDLDPEVVADVANPLRQSASAEDRAAFKRGELSRISDLQERTLSTADR